MTLSPQDQKLEEPWQARVYILTRLLIENGLFSAEEWSQRLSSELRSSNARGDHGEFYQAFVLTLEKLLAEKHLIAGDELDQRVNDWRNAYLSTPHGRQVHLNARQQDKN